MAGYRLRDPRPHFLWPRGWGSSSNTWPTVLTIPVILVQRWPKKCVLGCVIPPPGAGARSINLGQTFLANFVVLEFGFEGFDSWSGPRQCRQLKFYSQCFH